MRQAPPLGFTLVEMLVALTLLGVGVAAWLTTTTVAVRIAGAASRETAAHRRARSLAGSLTGSTCEALAPASRAGESWTVDVRPNGVRSIRIVVPFLGERTLQHARYEVVVLC